MSNAAASAIRDGPIRPAIVFEFAMDCLPARCRCGTSTDKNTHREEPARRSAATGPTPAISRRERAEKERAPPLHDNPKARRRGGRHTRGPAACCDARFRSDLVELIDFGKKLDDLVRASAYALATNNADKEFAKDVCGRAFDMNKYRRIVAHAFRTCRRRSAIQQSSDNEGRSPSRHRPLD